MDCAFCRSMALKDPKILAALIKNELTKKGTHNVYIAACNVTNSLGISSDDRSFYILEAAPFLNS